MRRQGGAERWHWKRFAQPKQDQRIVGLLPWPAAEVGRLFRGMLVSARQNFAAGCRTSRAKAFSPAEARGVNPLQPALREVDKVFPGQPGSAPCRSLPSAS